MSPTIAVEVARAFAVLLAAFMVVLPWAAVASGNEDAGAGSVLLGSLLTSSAILFAVWTFV